jgi:hypothetical protein
VRATVSPARAGRYGIRRKSHFKRLKRVYSGCKKMQFKKLSQTMGPSLQWPPAGPAAAGAAAAASTESRRRASGKNVPCTVTSFAFHLCKAFFSVPGSSRNLI